MARHIGLPLLVSVAVLAGCGAEDATGGSPLPPTYDLSDTTAWSGGLIEVHSTSFTDPGSLPLIVAGAETLAVAAKGPGTVEVRLPSRPSGPVVLVLHEGARRDTLGTVNLGGFSGVRWFTPGFEGYGILTSSERDGAPVVLGDASGNNGIVALYPAGGQSERITGVRSPAGYGIGPTYLPDRFVLSDSSNTIGIWSLWPVPSRVGGWPALSLNRHFAQLGPTIFLVGHPHLTWVSDTTSPARTYGPFDIEDSWMAALSPRGDRAVLASVGEPDGVPVFNSLTGDTAYRLSGNRSVSAVAFSPDGAVIHIAGYDLSASTGDSLRNFDATTGAQLAVAPLPAEGVVVGMVTDPAGHWLYLLISWPQVGVSTCAPRLLVLDAATLDRIGDAPVPEPIAGLTCKNNGWDGAIVRHATLGKIWIVWNGEPAPVFEFDVPQ